MKPLRGLVSVALKGEKCRRHEQEYSKCRPELPTHDQSATYKRRRIFCRVNGHRAPFTAHPDTEQQTTDEELLPCLGARRTDDREEAEDAGEEDGPASAEPVVERI